MRDPGPREPEGDSIAAITSVDCTPRPRYRETAEQFEMRLRALQVDAQRQSAKYSKINRKDALRWYTTGEGAKQYFTRCACGWCGLRVDDPEVARREYDAHACAMDAVEIGVSLHRKEPLPANWAEQTKAAIAQDQTERALETLVAPVEYAPVNTIEVTDDAGLRMSLLELK